MTLKKALKLSKNLVDYKDGYEIWIDKNFYHFDTAQEAYNFYLDYFATKQDFKYYKEICGKDLREINSEKDIKNIFDNVFNPRQHIYKVFQREDGQVCRYSI